MIRSRISFSTRGILPGLDMQRHEICTEIPVTTGPTDWWRSFHVPEMADILLVRDDDRALETTLDFLERELSLHEGSLVYDQCCGIGSMAIPLVRRGVRVIGADLCDFYI